MLLRKLKTTILIQIKVAESNGFRAMPGPVKVEYDIAAVTSVQLSLGVTTVMIFGLCAQ
jgi:hypothetical protein